MASAQIHATFTAQRSPNPPCYVCCGSSAPCDMIISKPDAIIPLPAFTGMASAACSDVQKYGEEMLMLPEFACQLLDREDFRLECGCEEAGFVDEDKLVGISVLLPEGPSADLPSDLPSTVPSDAPSMVPSDAPSIVPSDVPSTMPSDVPSILPLVRKRA